MIWIYLAVAGILEVDIADLEGDLRRILRVISNFINSDDFDNLGDVAVEVTNNMQDRMNAHVMALFPPPGQQPPDQEPGLGDAGDQGLNQQEHLVPDPPNLALAPVSQVQTALRERATISVAVPPNMEPGAQPSNLALAPVAGPPTWHQERNTQIWHQH